MFKYSKIILMSSAAVLLGAGCGKPVSQNASDRTMEKIIENQTGNKVNIDTSGNTIKYETKEGTFLSGENVQIPADFPKDIFVVEGKIISAISNKDKNVFSLSIQNTENAESLAKTYEDKLKSEGWKISGTMNFGETYSVIGEKGASQVSVIIGKSDDKTTVVISVGNK